MKHTRDAFSCASEPKKGLLASRFSLETLEPRVLLSASPLDPHLASPQGGDTSEAAVEVIFEGAQGSDALSVAENQLFNPADVIDDIFGGLEGSDLSNDLLASSESAEADISALSVSGNGFSITSVSGASEAQIDAFLSGGVGSLAFSGSFLVRGETITGDFVLQNITTIDGDTEIGVKAENASVTFGGFAAGVTLSDADGAFLITDAGIAGSLSGAVNLAGFSDLTLADNMRVVFNTTGAAVNESFVVSGQNAQMALTNPNFMQMEGRITLGLSGFAHLTGDFVLPQVTTDTVSLTDGGTADVLALNISGSNIHAFAGFNGPYWNDVDNDGAQDASEINGNAVGFVIENAKFGLTLMMSVTGRFHAAKIEADSVRTVGMDEVEISATDVNISLNGGGDSFRNPIAPPVIDFSADPLILGASGDPISIDFEDTIFSVSIGNAKLVLGDFIHVEGGFTFQKGVPVEVSVDGELKEVDLMSVGASNVKAFAGVGGSYFEDLDGNGNGYNDRSMGFVLEGVDIAIAMMEGSALTDFSSYFAAKVQAATAQVVGFGDIFELSFSGITLGVNTADHPLETALTPEEAIDFSATGGLAIPAGNSEVVLDFEGEIVQASVDFAELQISQFVQIQGSFAFQNGTSFEAPLDNGDSEEVDVMLIGASRVRAFVGIGGPYWTPTGTSDEATGFALEDVSLGLLIGESSSIFDYSSYFALKVRAESASAVGFGDAFKLDIQGITVGINEGSNPTATRFNPAPAIDFSALPEGGLAITTGAETEVADGGAVIEEVVLDFDGAILEAAIEFANLQIASFIQIQGSIAIEKGRSLDVHVGDDVKEVEAFTIGGSNLSLFAGAGGPYWNEDGSINNSADPMGFVLNDVDVGLAMLEATSLTDPSKYMALKVNAEQAAIVGFGDIFQVDVRGIEVGLNDAKDWSTPDIFLETIDFSQITNGAGEANGLQVKTGSTTPGEEFVTIDFEEAITRVTIAEATIQIYKFIYLTGSFAFEKGGTLEVPIEADDDGDVEWKEVESLTIGASNVYAFVGWDGPHWQYVTDATSGARTVIADPNSEAIGLAIEDFDFGMAILEPTSLVDFYEYVALKATAQSISFIGAGEHFKLSGEGITVKLNQGSSPTVLDHLESVIDFSALEGGGLEIETGGEPVLLDMDQAFVSVSVERATFQISELIFLTGSFQFEKGKTLSVPTAEGQDPEDWKEVETMTVGASDVYAFVGWGGPYWKRIADPADATKTIVIADPASEAIGLALEDLDLGLALFEPTSIFDAYSYTAMKATAASVSFVGLEENFQFSGENITFELNQSSNPLVLDAFEQPIYFPGLPGGGFEVPTGGEPVLLDFAEAFMSVSVERATLQISKFVYVTGSFEFQQGKTFEIPTAGGDVVEVESMTIGASDVYAFVGWDGPYWVRNGNGEIEADTNAGAIGLALEDLDLGVGIFEPTSLLDQTSYFALSASAGSIGFVGLEGDFELSGRGISLDLNQVSHPLAAPGIWEPEALNFSELNDGLGFAIETGSDENPVYLTSEDAIIAVSVEQATLAISEFVYLQGSFAFTKGDTHTVELSSATIFNDPEVEFLTIGASDVQAFVGINGPYRSDTNNDGVINGSDEVNESAVGFVLDNLDLGVAIMMPTNPLNFSKYYAVSLTADNAGLIGIEGLEISAQDLAVELNIGKVVGNPLNPPVVDFVASFPDPDGNGPAKAGYEVPTGAVKVVDGADVPVTINLDMESFFVRAASSKVVIDVFGVLSLVGGIEITRGAVYDVELTNGTEKEVTSLTIAGIDMFGFIGANGPYWFDRNDDGVITTDPNAPGYDAPNTDAIGLSISDVTIGAALFVPTNIFDFGRYIAIKGEIGGIDVVGLEFLRAEFRDIKLELNLGVGLTTGLGAIDFTKGPFANSNPALEGLILDTGGDTIQINFDEVFIQAQMAGEVALKIPGADYDLLKINGAFIFSLTTDSIQFFADGALELGVPGGDVFTLNARAVFVLNEDGFAADMSVSLDVGGDLEETFSMEAAARLRVNTTSKNQSITIPGSYVQYLAPETQALIVTAQDGTKSFVIPKGAPQLNGSIGPAGPYLVINATGEIDIGGAFVLQANLWFEASTDKLDMMMAAAMSLGPIGSASITGNLQISKSGLVASLDAILQTAPNIASALGITISGKFKVELNTTSSTAKIFRPLVDKRTGTFQKDGDGNFVLEEVDIAAKTVKVFGAGSLSFVDSFEVKTQFEFTGNPDGVVIGIDGYLKIGFIGEIAVQAGLAVRNDGIAARLNVSAGVGNDFGSGGGVKISGTFTLEINTTGHNVTLPSAMRLGARAITIQPGVMLRIEGAIDFLGFASASGSLEIAFRNNELRIDIDATLILGPISVHLDGFGIFRSGGIVLSVNVSVEADVLSIIKFTASGQLKINTTNSASNGIPANSFRLHLNGELSILAIFNMDASFTMFVSNYAWRIDVSASMSFFGLASLNATGWLDSDGHFEVEFRGEIVIGSRSNGLVGEMYFKVWFTGEIGEESFGITASGEVSARLFGFTLGGIGLSFTFQAQRTKDGDEAIKVTASATIRIKFLFFTFSATATFTLGYIRIPRPVFLAGELSQPEEWVGADEGGNGTLYLNVGDRASWRNLEEGDPSETYIIQHVAGSASDPSGETINVIGWGRTQRFNGVKKIVGYMADGDDFILLGEGVTAPVEIDGGSGDDQIIYEGTSIPGTTSTLNGGSGDDLLILTNAFIGSANLYGGSGNDRINGSSGRDVIFGDSGNDQINAGPGNDEIHDSSGSNILIGGAGNDTIHGGSDRDLIAGDELDYEWEMGSPYYFARTVNAGQGGSDTIFGNSGSDFILGGAGADSLFGGNGADLLVGDGGYLEFDNNQPAQFSQQGGVGSGDTLHGDDDNDILLGGAGSDVLRGGSDHDLIVGDNATIDYSSGTWTSATTEEGIGSGDSIFGDSGHDMILGGDGLDTFSAGSGDDLVFGDNGRITRNSSGLLNFAESYSGNGGSEELNGEDGNDILVGGTGTDTLFGHSGHDVLVSSGAVVDYSNGVLVRVTSNDQDGAQSETLYGDIGNDILVGGGGTDTLWAWDGDDILFGDHVELSYTNGALVTAVSILTTSGASDVLHGETGNDSLIGGFGADTLYGWTGNDLLIGDNGQLMMAGSARVNAATTSPTNGGTDTLWGYDGNDLAFGGTGVDSIYGEAGNDVVVGDQASVNFTNGSLTQVTSLDGAVAETADDVIDTGEGDNIAVGGLGSDTINAYNGRDLVIGDQASVTLTQAGVWTLAVSQDAGRGGNDRLSASAGNDSVVGGFGSDTVTGSTGDDVIVGDNGTITRTSVGALVSITTTDPSSGAADILHGDDSSDIMLGGTGADEISGAAHNDIIIGDQGSITFTNGLPTLITSNDGALSEVGDDLVHGGEGDNIVIAGLGNDSITTLSGHDTVAGDQAFIKILESGVWTEFTSIDTARGGQDTITTSAGSDTALGGNGSDVATAGSNADILIGDNGQVLRTSTGLLDFIASISTGDGSSDTLNGNEDGDVLIGGTATDSILGHQGNDIIIGDSGAIDYAASVLVTIRTSTPSVGASDTVSGNEDDDIILGGTATDVLNGNGGSDIVIGDQGLLTYTNGDLTQIATTDGDLSEIGGDTITADEGNNIVLGGLGSDSIVSLAGSDLIAGDQAILNIHATGVWFDFSSHDFGRGGDDSIESGGGADTIIAGYASDTVSGQAANDVIISDNGRITREANGWLSTISTIAPSLGGIDTVHGDEGDDILLGGTASDFLLGDAGNDIILGDQGTLSYTNGNLTQVTTTDGELTEAGSDTITGAEGHNMVFAGLGSDIIVTLSGNDLIAADQATLTITEAGVWTRFVSHDTNRGGSDSILAGAGNDVVLGGFGEDNITTEAGNDVAFGDNAEFTRTTSGLNVALFTIAPSEGSSDAIYGHEGADIILGGTASDTISSDDGNDIVIGDQGRLSYSNGNLTQITTTDDLLSEVGNDIITAGEGDNIVFAGLGSDTVTTLSGSDIVSGDQAALDILESGIWTNLTTHDSARGGHDLINTGGGDDIVLGGFGSDTVTAEANDDIVIGDNGQIVRLANAGLSLIHTTQPSIGNSDVIFGNEGNDIVFGGTSADSIATHDGDDIVLADQGAITFTNGNLTQITTKDDELTEVGDDMVHAGEGHNIVMGGLGSDTITTLSGSDIVAGDQATLNILESGVWVEFISHDFGRGGDDQIQAGFGDNVVFGGFAADNITTDGNNDIVVGDNGQGERLSNGWLAVIQTVAPSLGGADVIAANAGNDIVLGGTAGDQISTHDGDDIAVGDQAKLTYTNGNLTQITSTDVELSEVGDDLIDASVGNNIVFGGLGSDSITTLSGMDVVAGDQATLNILQSGVWVEFITHDVTRGGSDHIHSGAGDDVVLGGFGSDTIFAEANDDVVVGDNGQMLRHANGARSIITTNESVFGSDDFIFGNEGNDIIFGGTHSDTISGGSEKDLIFGDHGRVDYSMPAADNFRSIDTQAANLGAADFIHGDAGDDIILGGQGDDVIYGDAHDDDIIGGHNVALGHDELEGIAALNDRLDGGTGNDVIAGDNAWIIRRGDAITPRVRVLIGNLLYAADGSAAVSSVAQTIPTGAASRDIILLDHSTTPAPMVYGNDVIAGGAQDDLIFGQLGNEVIQGDSTIDHDPINGSLSSTSDGDDYIEGNGGEDRIYGNLGQDDIIGGNSNLFGLTTPAMRPDGSDTIFGGSGTDLARNTVGAPGENSHSRDADMVLGDNGRIFRVIGKGAASSAFLTFNYDNYTGATRIIPRAIDLLDYTANGLASDDIGAGDLIHGEAGDDILHGTSGNDVIYGEGQDDDIYGESGNDWLSGGTGEDGILGDDGKILTSRNGVAEPLYGLAAVAQSSVESKSMAATYLLNMAGRLNKSVDLEPFDIGGNDLIYGGLGDDFLHGGAGDDGVSGAEALPSIYADPASARAIVYDATVREFTDYNENDALLKVAGHALNFEAFVGGATDKVNDGNDVLFGDLGNDWLVGGTNSDHMFGGLGDDLMNCDDNLETNGGLNNAPDAGLYGDADLAYGGGGIDYMLGNTGADRMVDSHGEFNSYVVPFSPYGAATIIRALNPDTRDLLYAVSKSDGADQTRTGGLLGTSARNGEPFGEMGLVMQGDAEAGDQTGAPTDPQPGNGKAKKDVRR